MAFFAKIIITFNFLCSTSKDRWHINFYLSVGLSVGLLTKCSLNIFKPLFLKVWYSASPKRMNDVCTVLCHVVKDQGWITGFCYNCSLKNFLCNESKTCTVVTLRDKMFPFKLQVTCSKVKVNFLVFIRGVQLPSPDARGYWFFGSG